MIPQIIESSLLLVLWHGLIACSQARLLESDRSAFNWIHLSGHPFVVSLSMYGRGFDVCTTFQAYRGSSLSRLIATYHPAPSHWCRGSLQPRIGLNLNQRSQD